MKTIEIKLYELHELSTTALDNAIYNLGDINTDTDWYNFILEDASGIGLKIETFDIHNKLKADGHLTLSANEVAQNIFNEYSEDSKTYKTALEFMDKWQPIFSKYMEDEGEELENKLIEIESDFLNSLLCDYVTTLYEHYNYLISDEAIIEAIEANGYLFTEKGNLYDELN